MGLTRFAASHRHGGGGKTARANRTSFVGFRVLRRKGQTPNWLTLCAFAEQPETGHRLDNRLGEARYASIKNGGECSPHASLRWNRIARARIFLRDVTRYQWTIMQSERDLIESIVADFVRLASLGRRRRDPDDPFPFPRLIAVGDGRSIQVSQRIDQLISDLARRRMTADVSLKSRFTAAEFAQIARAAFGPALAVIDLDGDIVKNAAIVHSAVDESIAEEIGWISGGVQEYALACTLFSQSDVPPFRVGPVRIEPRNVWLGRKADEPSSFANGPTETIADTPVSQIIRRRITRIWNGERLKPRKPSTERDFENNILDAVGDCPYICSVVTVGLGRRAGAQRALVAARLALAAVALIWDRPGDALSGFNLYYDRETRLRSLLSFAPEGVMTLNRQRSPMPHGPWVEQSTLEKKLKEFEAAFAATGDAISCLLDPGAARRPRLMSVLAQALLWFHEGCREGTDLVAVVSFASCMDVLAGGDGRKGICKLIRARVGFAKDAVIHRDGLTVSEVIDLIYDDGRTRMVHGPNGKRASGWEKLGHDWSEARSLAEWLARNCLIGCLFWTAAHPDSDDWRELLGDAETTADGL